MKDEHLKTTTLFANIVMVALLTAQIRNIAPFKSITQVLLGMLLWLCQLPHPMDKNLVYILGIPSPNSAIIGNWYYKLSYKWNKPFCCTKQQLLPSQEIPLKKIISFPELIPNTEEIA